MIDTDQQVSHREQNEHNSCNITHVLTQGPLLRQRVRSLNKYFSLKRECESESLLYYKQQEETFF